MVVQLLCLACIRWGRECVSSNALLYNEVDYFREGVVAKAEIKRFSDKLDVIECYQKRLQKQVLAFQGRK